jgi:hypothetical protein
VPQWVLDGNVNAEHCRAAIDLLSLVTGWHEWVNRRVEHIEFLDEGEFLRMCSIDVTIPASPAGGAPKYLPLTFVNKAEVWHGPQDRTVPLKALSVKDETGRGISILSSAYNKEISRAALRLKTAQVLGPVTVHPAILSAIDKLVDEDRLVGPQTMRNLRAYLPGGPRAEVATASGVWLRSQVESLFANRIWETLSEALSRSYPLHAVVQLEPGEQRIFKFSYLDSWAPTDQFHGRLQRVGDFLRRTFADRGYLIGITVAASQARAYHVEVSAPEDLVIAHAELVDIATAPEAVDERRWVYIAHLYGAFAKGQRVELHADLRLRPTGLVSGSLFLSGLLALMLGSALVAKQLCGAVQRPGEGTGALLLVIPGLLQELMLRQRLHALARKMFIGLRLTMIMVAVTSFAAAGVLGVSMAHGPSRQSTWCALLVASAVWTTAPARHWIIGTRGLRRIRRKM